MATRDFVTLCADLLRGGQGVSFPAPGWSMHPTIRDGETLTVAPVEPARLRRGDVVLYRSPRGLTAHRVVRLPDPRCAGFVVRGDAGGDEEAVAEEQVLGVVVAVERDGRRLGPATLAARRLAAVVRRCARPLLTRVRTGLRLDAGRRVMLVSPPGTSGGARP